MLKPVQVQLAKIKYSGDSIGDDIRVEIEILGKSLRVDKRIKTGTAVETDQEVGRFETDQGSFSAEVSITVIEKDLLFNDVGSVSGSIKVNTGIAKSQQFAFEVRIRETRSILGKFWGDRTADFEITLKATIGDIERYAPDSKDGWLVVRDSKNAELSLPAYIKVKPEYIKNKREYFTPLEGAYRRQLLSVKLNDDGSSHFISGVKHKPMAKAVYSISKKLLTLNGKKYKTVDYPSAPWRKDLYDIEIPDYPHPGGRNYENAAPHSKVWFRVGHSGDKYIHAGARSLGCITLVEYSKWEEVYYALIKARKGDFDSVGVIEVIDQ